MPVDLIALFLTLYGLCEQAPDGVYKTDDATFYSDTGYTTFNVLSPLLAKKAIEVKTPDYGRNYHISITPEGRFVKETSTSHAR